MLLIAIGSLMKFSFVRQGTSHTIYLHPLVHHWASEKLSKDSKRESELIICIIGMISSVFKKQDQLPPLTSRICGSRGLEDAGLPLWPWRRYPRLVPHVLRCIQHSLRMRFMPESIVVRTLSLLQVLEYSTFGDLAMDQEISVNLIQSMQQMHGDQDNAFLEICALMWRLTRSEICPCRKAFEISDAHDPTEGSRKSEKFGIPEGVCNTCEDVYDKIKALEMREQSPRLKALMTSFRSRLLLDKDLHSHEALMDRLTRCESSRKRPMAIEEGQPKIGAHVTFQRKSLGSVSWMENYGSETTNYVFLRSQGELHYTHVSNQQPPWPYLRHHSKRKQKLDIADVCTIRQRFKELCGEISEECRRSAFYESSSMISLGAWDEVEHCLERLVLDSIEHPVQSWSHERCIIRYVEALSNQGRRKDAGKIIQKAQESYKASGKQLKAGTKSPLVENILRLVRLFS